jgi:hypothetical protein
LALKEAQGGDIYSWQSIKEKFKVD